MNFPFLVAKRYLFSRKSTNAINVISIISMVGMGLGATVLVILLSVFNGFEDTILTLYNSFYTDLVVLPAKGKAFQAEEDILKIISGTEGVEAYSLTLSENVYLEYDKNDYIGKLKGVDENFSKITRIDSFSVEGSYYLKDSSRNYAYLGSGIAMALGVNAEHNILPLKIHIPRRGKIISMLPQNAFKVGFLYPSGVFNLQQEINQQFVLTNLDFMRDLLNYDDEVSAIELKVKKGNKLQEVQKNLQAKLGDSLLVKSKFEQQESLYRVMKTEKWTVFALLSFIMFVISFNILGSLSMLVIEKQKDISILKSMGAGNALIRRIFFLQGVLMSVMGGLTGIFLGLIICLIQIRYGIIQIPGSENFIIDAYPVKIIAGDLILVLVAVIIISCIASSVPSLRASKVQGRFREA